MFGRCGGISARMIEPVSNCERGRRDTEGVDMSFTEDADRGSRRGPSKGARGGHSDRGSALYASGELLSRGHNRAYRMATQRARRDRCLSARGRQRSYRDMVMVTTLRHCWDCSGLVRQFRIGTLVWRQPTFAGGLDWLRENGVEVIDLDDRACANAGGLHAEHPKCGTRYRGRVTARGWERIGLVRIPVVGSDVLRRDDATSEISLRFFSFFSRSNVGGNRDAC